MATLDNDDLKAIKDLIEVTLDEKLDGNLWEKLSHIPNKDEFYGIMEKLMGELRAIREEITVLEGKVSEHADRIETLENDQVTSN